MLSITPLEQPLPCPNVRELDPLGPEFEAINRHVHRGEYIQAAKIAEELWGQGIHDSRTLGYYLFGVFIERGLPVLPALFACLQARLRDSWEFISPVERKERHIDTALRWFCSQVVHHMEHYKRHQDQRWVSWQTPIHKPAVDAAYRDSAQLATVIGDRMPQGRSLPALLHLKTVLEVLHNEPLPSAGFTVSAEAEQKKREEAQQKNLLEESEDSGDGDGDSSGDSSPSSESAAESHSSPLTDNATDRVDDSIKPKDSAADATATSIEAAPRDEAKPDGAKSDGKDDDDEDDDEDDDNENDDDEIVDKNSERGGPVVGAEPSGHDVKPEDPPAGGKSPAAPPGPALVSESLSLPLTPALRVLLRKIGALEELCQKKRYRAAAIIARDLNTTLAAFDPKQYLPSLIIGYFRALARYGKSLGPALKEDPPAEDFVGQALISLYETDLEGFLVLSEDLK